MRQYSRRISMVRTIVSLRRLVEEGGGSVSAARGGKRANVAGLEHDGWGALGTGTT